MDLYRKPTSRGVGILRNAAYGHSDIYSYKHVISCNQHNNQRVASLLPLLPFLYVCEALLLAGQRYEWSYAPMEQNPIRRCHKYDGQRYLDTDDYHRNRICQLMHISDAWAAAQALWQHLPRFLLRATRAPYPETVAASGASAGTAPRW